MVGRGLARISRPYGTGSRVSAGSWPLLPLPTNITVTTARDPCDSQRVIEPPKLDEKTLADAIADAWVLDVTGLTFLPVGLEGWTYRVDTVTGDSYFLKLRKEASDAAALEVPRALVKQGIDRVVAPIAADTGELNFPVAGHWLLLYPYIASSNLWDTGLTEPQWIEYGRLMAAIHAAAPPPDTAMPVEKFATTAPDSLRAMADVAPSVPDLADLWAARGTRLLHLADETEHLAAAAADIGADLVLCHTDIHLGNLLADRTGRLNTIDWDAPILAPKERDLMFPFSSAFSDAPPDPRHKHLFRTGYGPLDLDPTLMAYYQTERTIDDIAQFLAAVADPAVGAATRANALHWLQVAVGERT